MRYNEDDLSMNLCREIKGRNVRNKRSGRAIEYTVRKNLKTRTNEVSHNDKKRTKKEKEFSRK